MLEVQKEVNTEGPNGYRWNRECSVEFKFHDLDHANKFAKVMAKLLWDASAGGDFEINGEQVGHDVCCRGVVVKAP